MFLKKKEPQAVHGKTVWYFYAWCLPFLPEGVACDTCSQFPLTGIRYKCGYLSINLIFVIVCFDLLVSPFTDRLTPPLFFARKQQKLHRFRSVRKLREDHLPWSLACVHPNQNSSSRCLCWSAYSSAVDEYLSLHASPHTGNILMGPRRSRGSFL